MLNRNTSSAVEYDIFEDIRTARIQKDKEREDKRRQLEKQKEAYYKKLRNRLVCAIMVVFAIACTILYRNTMIIQAVSTVDALTSQLNDIKNTNTKRELQLERSLDLNYVEEVATRKLGMKRPDKFQTVYVDVTQDNYAEVMMPSSVDNSFHGAFSVITDGMSNVLEYLQ